MQKIQKYKRRFLAFLMCAITIITTILSSAIVTTAADGTITFNSGETLSYGTYYTAKMTFDGANTAYCVEPLKKTPPAGIYEYNLLGNDSPVRKALYYLPGGYGYAGHIKNQYLGGWAENDAYVIGHLTVAYTYAGYDAGSGAFYGAPQNYIDKAVEVANVISGLPEPPKSFKAFLVSSGSNQTVAGSWYQVPYGYIEIRKSTANGGISDGNGNYSLAGAKYGIFSGERQVGTLVTDDKGYAKSEGLEVQEGAPYTVRELQASPGYAIDTQSYNVVVKSEVTASLDVKEVPQNNPIDLTLQKIDAETKENVPQGTAFLENAEFTLKYYTTQSDIDPASAGISPERTWVFRTDREGKIKFTKDYLVSGDEFYYQTDGTTPCLPLGTVTVQESKSPEGYLKNDTVFVQRIVAGGSKETVECYQSPVAEEQVYRGDLEFVKVSDGDLNRLADVPFSITSKTTGESHTIVTDKNGYANTAASWNLHTTDTNRGKTSKDGIWFGTSAPDNERGALIYDTYVIEEQRCKANEGMNLLKLEVVVYKDSVTIPLGTLTDDRITIATTALDKETSSHLGKPDDKVTLIDTVEYEGLKKGQEYRITGVLMDRESGKPILIKGKQVTAETTFTAKRTTGSVKVYFTFDGSSLKGKTVVVFEELYQKDQKLAVHADIKDSDQTIYFPEIGTSAKDGETEGNISKADKEVTLIDTVSYRNLIPQKEYKVTGVLMDQESGQPIQIDGEMVTAETIFTPESKDGTVDVLFTFDGRSLLGRTIVVFESLLYEGQEIGVHADLEDKGQTVHFPEVRTTARDKETDSHVSHPDGDVTIIDTVSYTNLIPGKEYKISGILMEKESKKRLEIAGKEVTAEAVFTPEKSSGEVELAFTFDGSALTGKAIVVFESLLYKEKEIAVHADIEDEKQTIYFPEIHTTAKDGEDGDKEIQALSKVTLVDTVSYKNLEPGRSYHLTGILMDKSTGKPLEINAKPVTADAVFKPEKAEGTIDVTFTFDATGLEGKKLVVFETLFDAEGKEEVLIASHEDMEDEGQTVSVIENVKPETPAPQGNSPKTGDHSKAGLWIAIAAVAVLGISVCTARCFYRRKKRKKGE